MAASSTATAPVTPSSASLGCFPPVDQGCEDVVNSLATMHFSHQSAASQGAAAASLATRVAPLNPLAAPFFPAGARNPDEVETIRVSAPGSAWQFPSDHPPVGATLECKYRAVSWNVLNTAYIPAWIDEKNTQGLRGSSLTTENAIQEMFQGLPLTVREIKVVQAIHSMVTHPTCPKHVLALQECGPAFLAYLEHVLPKYMDVVRQFPPEKEVVNQCAIVYDSRQFKLVQEVSNTRLEIFSQRPDKLVMSVVLQPIVSQSKRKNSPCSYVIVNAHVPYGYPTLLPQYELIEFMTNLICTRQLVEELASVEKEWTSVEKALRRSVSSSLRRQLEQKKGLLEQRKQQMSSTEVWQSYVRDLGTFLNEHKHNPKVVVLGDMNVAYEDMWKLVFPGRLPYLERHLSEDQDESEDDFHLREPIQLLQHYRTNVGPASSETSKALGLFSACAIDHILVSDGVKAQTLKPNEIFPPGTEFAEKMQTALRLLSGLSVSP